MSVDTIELVINERACRYAKIYASLISDIYQRKRANAAICALFAYAEVLYNISGIDVQNSMTLYRTPFLCEQFEIADFYVNNYHIDVRITNDENLVYLPKIHYDCNIVPDFYVVIKLDKTLKNTHFVGVIDTKKTSPEPFDYHYYKIDSSKFITHEEFLEKVSDKKILKFDKKDHEYFQENYLAFIDGEMKQNEKIELLQHLFKCNDCRTEFCCYTGFEMVSKNTSSYPDILNDETLNIIGAQCVDDEKYKGKEEVIYIGNSDNDKKQQTIDNKNDNINEQDFVNSQDNDENDILDELFDASEENIAELDTENDDINDNKQKVIIDYEENGEPIYSYITGTEEIVDIQEEPDVSLEITEINDETEDRIVDNDIQDITENNELDILDEMFIDGNLSDETTNDEQEISYFEEQELNKTSEEAEIQQIDELDETIDSVDNNSEQSFSESDNVTVDDMKEISQNTENKNEEIQAIEIDEGDSDKMVSEDKGNNKILSKFVSENNNIKSDINNDNDLIDQNDDIQNQDKYSDFDEESSSFDDIENTVSQGSSSGTKGFLVLIVSIVLLVAIITGGYFVISNAKNSDKSLNSTEKPIAIENIKSENNEAKNEDTSLSTNISKELNKDTNTTHIQNEKNEAKIEDTTASTNIPQKFNNDSKSNQAVDVKNLTEKDLNAKQKQTDVNKVIANALSAGRNLVTLGHVEWECKVSLHKDLAFQNYMKDLDNVLKQNLKNNIMGVTEIPPKRRVVAKLALDNNRNLQKVIITESSESEEVDKIVLQSINETFEREKSPILTDSPNKANMYYLNVAINL